MACQQCQDAPCMGVCPATALSRNDELNKIEVDYDKCIGCRSCVAICPFGAMGFNSIDRKVFKCDLCDGDPLCVKACPKEALKFHPKHILGQAHRLSTARSYAKMSKVEYMDDGQKKTLKYAKITKEKKVIKVFKK